MGYIVTQYPTSVIQAGLLSYYIYINLVSAVMPPQYQNYHKWDYAIPYRIGDLFEKLKSKIQVLRQYMTQRHSLYNHYLKQIFIFFNFLFIFG